MEKKMKDTITIELNQEELNSLIGLLDAGVKAAGLNSVKLAAHIVGKLEEAVAEVNKEAEQAHTPTLEVVE